MDYVAHCERIMFSNNKYIGLENWSASQWYDHYMNAADSLLVEFIIIIKFGSISTKQWSGTGFGNGYFS